MKLPRFHSLPISILFVEFFAALFYCFGAQTPNIATPEKHPFADPEGGREGYQLSNQRVNEARLYQFYQRQADYYMAHPEKTPDILPAFPGLDGGKYGHWGKYNQNNHGDGRWNDIEFGEVVPQVFRTEDLVVLKGICLRLGDQRELSAVFDPMSLTYRCIWQDGFIRFDPFRWGTSRNAQLEGNPWFKIKEASMPEGGLYHGYHRYGKRVVFDYSINDINITDEPWAKKDVFYRRIDIKEPVNQLSIPIPLHQNFRIHLVDKRNIETVSITDEELRLSDVNPGAALIVRVSKDADSMFDEAAKAYLNTERKFERRWTETLEMPGALGTSRIDSAYVVDTLNVPYDNPYHTVMQLTSIGFLGNGDALVSTLAGDIWLVSGIDDDLESITWRRFATGFNQPIGIHIDQDGIFVLDRGQIYRLHDANSDGEVDFYENYANDFGGYNRSHSHTFGLHRTEDGSFHFTQRESILRTGPDRVTTTQAWGVRNCMGIGGSNNYFWVAPQEGTWTPASAIIEVNQGEFYGLPTSDGKGGTIAAPLCFIPRGIDNSTGGMLEVTSNRWGPFNGSHIGLSYGASHYYLILRDDKGPRPQGAIVPLEGEFLSGSMRGAFHPEDGQLYLVGMDGWGDYSVQDGCFHRVRYSGGAVHKPKGFQVHSNGIRIDFTTQLARENFQSTANIFAQSWNYEYAKRYGSPEFSVGTPDSLGHDPVAIRSVKLLENGSSIFVEMPALEPVMQLHIRMHLHASDGTQFKTDLFASPMFPGPHFEGPGLEPPRQGKPMAIALRVDDGRNESSLSSQSGTPLADERKISIDAIGGLQYAQKIINVSAGESLALTLVNKDVMPHNLVIVNPGSAKIVGDASFKMLSDPQAGKKHYVPSLPEVLNFIPIVNPGKTHTLHFKAPESPGDYPYICTFPGHWMAMQGILRVVEP